MNLILLICLFLFSIDKCVLAQTVTSSTDSSSNGELWDEDGKWFLIKAGACILLIIGLHTGMVLCTYMSFLDYHTLQRLKHPKRKRKSKKSSKKSLFARIKRKFQKKKITPKNGENRRELEAKKSKNKMEKPGPKRAHLMGTEIESIREDEMTPAQIAFIKNKKKTQPDAHLLSKFKSRGPLWIKTARATWYDFPTTKIRDDKNKKPVKIEKVKIDEDALFTYQIGFETESFATLRRDYSGRGSSRASTIGDSILYSIEVVAQKNP